MAPHVNTQARARSRAASRRNEPNLRPSRSNLGPEQSEALREQLIADLVLLNSEDEAADWVHKNLPAKSRLTATDADLVETSFRDKLAAIELASASTRVSRLMLVGLREKRSRGTLRHRAANPLYGDGHVNANSNRPADEASVSRCCRQDHSPARQRALNVRLHATLRRLRPEAERGASHSLRPAPSPRPKSQRRIHDPGLSGATRETG